jgi:hypothetical protein
MGRTLDDDDCEYCNRRIAEQGRHGSAEDAIGMEKHRKRCEGDYGCHSFGYQYDGRVSEALQARLGDSCPCKDGAGRDQYERRRDRWREA